MTHVVGTGCMATSVIGAFTAAEPNLALAAACGPVCYGIAGEIAAAKAAGPASFKQGLLAAYEAFSAAAGVASGFAAGVLVAVVAAAPVRLSFSFTSVAPLPKRLRR